MNELKPCPFCGDKAKESKIFGRDGVICRNCPAEMRSDEICSDEYTSVIEAWNARALPSPTIITDDESTHPEGGQLILYRMPVDDKWTCLTETYWFPESWKNYIGCIWWAIGDLFQVSEDSK